MLYIYIFSNCSNLKENIIKDEIKNLIIELDEASNFLIEQTQETGISFRVFVNNQKLAFNKLISLAENARLINNKCVLTPEFMKELVSFHEVSHKTINTLYNCNIDIINMDQFSLIFTKLLKLLFSDIDDDYISVYLYEWDCCSNKEQEITWMENNQEHKFLISKDVNTLCEFLCPNKNYYH